MIPEEWEPVRREDGELVGYRIDGEQRTLIGLPLDSGTLEERGLIALDGRWQARLPKPLPPGVLDASQPADDWAWRDVVVAETNPTECRIRLYLAYPEELKAHASLPVPVGDLLRRPE